MSPLANTHWIQELYWGAPLFFLAASALALMTAGLFLSPARELRVYATGTIAALVIAILLAFARWQTAPSLQFEVISATPFRFFFVILLTFSSLILALIAPFYTQTFSSLRRPEFYLLILFATTGFAMMNLSENLLFIFLGLELASFSFYILIGMRDSDRLAHEALLKYFLLGALASALFAYGIAFFYGATADLHLSALVGASFGRAELRYLQIAGIFLFAGFAFKLALFPFYFWTPDVYQGAPTPLTGWMAAIVKVGVFGVLLTVLAACLPWLPYLKTVAITAAGATMLIGNLLALRQNNLKRLLACSSIAHAGYALLGIVAGLEMPSIATGANGSVLYYLLTYVVMTLGAFAALSMLSVEEEWADDRLTWNELTGLSERNPQLALFLAIFAFSLAGFPPTAGFFAKYTILRHALDAELYGLVGLALFSSLIGLFYYLKIISAMYFEPTPSGARLAKPVNAWVLFVVAFLGIASLLLGIFPEEYLRFSILSAGLQ